MEKTDLTEKLTMIAWPASRLGEAIKLLGERRGLSPNPAEIPLFPKEAGEKEEALAEWVEDLAQGMGIEAEPVEVRYGEVDTFLLCAGPALIRLPGGGHPFFLALLGRKKGKSFLLGPDGTVYSWPASQMAGAICAPLEKNFAPQVDDLLRKAEIPQKNRPRIRQAILAQYLFPFPVRGCWLLRPAPYRSFYRALLQAKVVFPFFTFLFVHIFQYLLWIISWWVIGKGALEGHLQPEWILGWGLILLSMVPLKGLVIWAEGRLNISLGGVFKQRLLYGAMRIKPDDIRHLGVGALLGRVFESEAVETLSLRGGFMGILALFELLIALGVLLMGAAGWLHTLLFAGWMVLFWVILARYWKARTLWTETRFQMTNDLVEKMTGHRTRLAQEIKENWHQGEDEALEEYLKHSKTLDHANLFILSLISRGWLVLGLIGLAPALVKGTASPASLAVSVGGILLIYEALSKLSSSLVQLCGASIAWKYVSPFLSAASQPEETGDFSLRKSAGHEVRDVEQKDAQSTTHDAQSTMHDAQSTTQDAPLLVSRNLFFQYPNRRDPVIQEGNFSIYRRDRVLLEGPSGCGKSTLVALLSNLRLPKGGVILLHGLDRHILGERYWRKSVSIAPQFHENHTFTETFAFNLLMGRRWPPRLEDLQEAEAVCQELGLGELMEKMPAGLLQMVGETGWQLSHGEKSRLYMARTLLQDADLLILDETFAALDPQTLEQCLLCVLRRARALLVITHR